MSRFRALLGFMTCLVLLTFLLDAGCSRPTGLNGTEGSAATDQRQVPLREADGKGPADSNATAVSPVSDKSVKTDTGLPFRDPDNLPAGTLLTVRLKNPVLADDPEASGRFEGVIDEPVTVDGNILVPSGSSVAGRVESVRSSKVKRSGFVRVTLDSIDIAGKDLHLQTSSLFARGNGAGHNRAIDAITLEKGRRLTFRLTEPAYLVQPSNR
jgi:hypothetical protein